MASIPTANGGIDADDKRDEEEEDDDEEEAVEEEEEVEPRLKYQRMGGSVPSLLTNDAATCISVAERLIALGTHNGCVHVLDFLGYQVKEFRAHKAAVNGLSFDTNGEYIGSCSDDGTVVINSLFSDEIRKYEYDRPMKAIALDPDYARKSSKRFVTGGLAGQLIYHTKTWSGFGYQDQVLHSGEGPIHAVTWRTSLIAWANDAGVKVYDAANNQKLTFIERPRGSPHPELLLPHLVWQDDDLLVIGWGTSVKIASLRSSQNKGVNGSYRLGINQVDIVASFKTSYYISGIAPFGDSLVVLAYIPREEDKEKEFSSSASSKQGNAQRPEVRVVTWDNDDLATDALPVNGFEHYRAKDYSLAHTPFSGSNHSGGQWTKGDEPLYYIVSPKDVVIAKPRDAEDHIYWLVNHGWHEKAFEAVEARQVQDKLRDEVGTRYLDHLFVGKKYAEAASLCPKVLRGCAPAWEKWAHIFYQLGQLPALVPYIPIKNPRLSNTTYESALVALATNPTHHKDLLSYVKSWPPTIYSASSIISTIEPQLKTPSMTDSLKEVLAELYVIDGQYEKAFSLFPDLLKPDAFNFIKNHNLHDYVISVPEKLNSEIKYKLSQALAEQYEQEISYNGSPESSSIISSLRYDKRKMDIFAENLKGLITEQRETIHKLEVRALELEEENKKLQLKIEKLENAIR